MTELNVVKIGGAVLENKTDLNQFLNDFANLPGYKILVHGGGRTATQLSEKLNIPTVMVGGRRITDASTLEIVTMVYGGLINRTAVSELECRGINALGVTGADLNLIESVKRPVKDGIDYGFVGDVVAVNSSMICKLLDLNITPVFSPITHDRKGQLLNTNADTIASEIAIALSGYMNVTLTFCLEKPGVLANPDDNNSVIKTITSVDFKHLKEKGVISQGMIPKVENALKAVEKGVKKVIIKSFNCVNNELSGTHIS